MELKRSDPRRAVGLAGNPAAPESALVVAELRLGRKLPPSYREFLAFCDGWPSFFEATTLLGTGDIGRRTCDAAAARMVHERCLLPFGVDARGACLFAFDTRVRLADGELPVVAWMGGLGIDCRCFTGFLATVLQLCRAELVQVKASEPPEGGDAHAENPGKAAPSARLSPARGRAPRAPARELGDERAVLSAGSRSPTLERAVVWRAADVGGSSADRGVRAKG